MSLIRTYVKGWKLHDIAMVRSCLHESCEIIECYGPIYRGMPTVELWMRRWSGTGKVVAWDITRLWQTPSFEAAEWRFACEMSGVHHEFDGASVCDIIDGKIKYLREFATTHPLYEWTGEWRS